MNLLDRFVLSIYTFCLAVISLFVIFVAVDIVPYSIVNNYITIVLNSSKYVTITIIIAAIFFIVSLRFLLSGNSKQSKNKSAIEKNSQLGRIKISLTGIKSLITSTVKEIEGVMDVKISVENKGDKVGVRLNVIVTPQQSIPEISTIIQSKTKESIESIAGVEVAFTEVMVEDIAQTITPRTRERVE